MTAFTVIYRDDRGRNHQTAVCSETSCGAVKAVLRLIPDAVSAWVIGFAQ